MDKMDFAQNVRQQQNDACGVGYRWSESEGRCVPDAFNLFGNNENQTTFNYTFASSQSNQGSDAKENQTSTEPKKQVWKIVLGVFLVLIVGYVLYHFIKTGKIKLPKRISVSRPVAPKVEFKGGDWGGIGIK
jgi:hypothetical protein